LGRRISKTVRDTNGTTATTHYGWDGDRLVHEAKENHRTTVVYEPGSFVPMLRIDQAGDGAAKQISAYVTDALGTPMQLVTPRGDTLWQAQPDDWAAVTNEQGRTAQPIRFQGQWQDEESGLYYNRHRYYDPQQGRYISQDPIGLNGGTNLYGYVTNPTGMVDPLGLFGRPGPIDQSGRQGRVGAPIASQGPAPRSPLERLTNAALGSRVKTVTGGTLKIDPATGAFTKTNPYLWGFLAIFKPNEISVLQTRNYDSNGDGLSDEHYQVGMCVPGVR
ncbi:RHS domain-containing protein, partial [Halomonas sp. ANAO-440]|uniref:RHS repeat-associated core domain-containing protein n=1 Tax=Halomonas sp. ANAO-440 TaxID=2861360 RepID=UPI001CAA4BC5